MNYNVIWYKKVTPDKVLHWILWIFNLPVHIQFWNVLVLADMFHQEED